MSGFACGKGGCLPLSKGESDALWAVIQAHKRERAERMPTEESAVRALFEAWQRLKELGWREAMYAPTDRRFWVNDESDSWPSSPILFRSRPTDTEGK